MRTSLSDGRKFFERFGKIFLQTNLNIPGTSRKLREDFMEILTYTSKCEISENFEGNFSGNNRKNFANRSCHEKNSYVLDYAFFHFTA